MTYLAGQRITAAQLNAVQIVPVAPTSTTSNGTVTSGSTEVRDDVLGVYQWTAVAGLRYRAVCGNLLVSGSSVSNDLYTANIRYRGDGTTPSNTDTLVALDHALVTVNGGPGQAGLKPAGTFLASASGTNTIALFLARLAGAGTGTPVSGSLARELYVELVGTV